MPACSFVNREVAVALRHPDPVAKKRANVSISAGKGRINELELLRLFYLLRHGLIRHAPPLTYLLPRSVYLSACPTVTFCLFGP